MTMFRSILAFVLLFSLPTSTGFAFIDTSSMEESLDSLEQKLSEGGDLGSLLEELNEVAEENADAYLTMSADGEAVTLRDVPKDAWFYAYVYKLTDLGIVSGYKDASGKLIGLY